MFLIEPNGIIARVQADDFHHFGIAQVTQAENPNQLSIGQ